MGITTNRNFILGITLLILVTLLGTAFADSPQSTISAPANVAAGVAFNINYFCSATADTQCRIDWNGLSNGSVSFNRGTSGTQSLVLTKTGSYVITIFDRHVSSGHVTYIARDSTNVNVYVDTNLLGTPTDFNGVITHLLSQVNDLNSRLTTLQNTPDVDLNYDANIVRINAEIADIYKQLDTLNDVTIPGIQDSIMDVNTALIAQIGDLNADMQAEFTIVNSNISSLQSGLASLSSRVDSIATQLNRMNHGTLNLHFVITDDGKLTARGEAPFGTTKVDVRVLDVAGHEVQSVSTTPDYNLEYSYTFDNVNNWNAQVYEVEAKFSYAAITPAFRSPSRTHSYQIGQPVTEAFDTLAILAQDSGFSFQSDTLENFCYVRSTDVPVSFEFKAKESGQYDFKAIFSSDGEVYAVQDITSSYVNQFETKNFHGTLNVVPYSGEWTIRLVADKRYGHVESRIADSYLPEHARGHDVYSNTFYLTEVNDCSLLTQSVNIVTPVSNSDMNLAYPFGSIKDNVFWTQSGEFNLSAYLNSNNKILGQTCQFKYRNATSQPIGIATEADVVTTDGQNGACDTNANTNWWGNVNTRNNSTTLSAYALFSGAQQSASVEIGVDNTAPVITQVTPSLGVWSHNLHIDVNATDDLSGISHVDLEIVPKDSNTVLFTVTGLSFNSENNLFYADINTLLTKEILDTNCGEECGTITVPIIPDGSYNIVALAYDIAGNESQMTVDPSVDNTPPVITGTSISANPLFRGGTITLDANVTDNLAGVNQVIATITGPNVSETLDLNFVSGTILNGAWEGKFDTNVDWNAGAYTIVFTAYDKAIPANSSTQALDVNVFQNYVFNLTALPSPIVRDANITISGQLINDANVDINGVIVTLGVPWVGNVDVNTDENGVYTYTIPASVAGIFDINVTYATADVNYVAHTTLTVNNPVVTPPTNGGGGGGGGIGGGLRIIPQSTDTNTSTDSNVPVETPQPIITPPTTSGDNNNSGNTATGGTASADVNAPTTDNGQSGPTGLFGLGALGNIGVPIVLFILIALGILAFISRRQNN